MNKTVIGEWPLPELLYRVCASVCMESNLECRKVNADKEVQLDVANDMQMCLVVTDIENSTHLSVVNPMACAASQDKHDAIMMDLIQQYHGTELLREGDSFRVAFKQVTHAIQFCLKVLLLHITLRDTLCPCFELFM